MIEHFTYGLLTPALSFVLSCLGCAAGLSCTARARLYTGRARRWWLWMGAVAIGGTGIWVMHFVAMLGFSVEGAEIRYDIPLTVASAVLAIGVVAIGLFMVDRSGGRTGAVVVGGTVAGLGVSSMHYLGMRAMHTDVAIDYDPWLVTLSVAIGVVAASAGLWLAFIVRTTAAGAAAAVVMGVAVSGMHYTGMAAMNVEGHADHGMSAPDGLTTGELLVPLIIFLTLSTLALVVTVVLARSPGEITADRAFDEWRNELRRSTDDVDSR
ncbi:MHYT domain-containing protein [Isoptericola sp. AK164]|uniref:MHYT domain-containing protein n=1 Tax=Isoptericola sp. AK164 TaxID=3024246 RepID=UPI002418A93D|nr:MHYT domain-containing protein [Isoptericola sp. AK164]